mgnify:CR=1 FL=1
MSRSAHEVGRHSLVGPGRAADLADRPCSWWRRGRSSSSSRTGSVRRSTSSRSPNSAPPPPYDRGVEFPIPTSLSPSRVDAFTNCPLQFRFASIERLPEAKSPHAVKGSLVHRALELLFGYPPAERTPAAAGAALATAVAELPSDPEYLELALSPEDHDALVADATRLVERYFEMEDPSRVREIGLELRLEAPIGELSLRGIVRRRRIAVLDGRDPMRGLLGGTG